MKMQWEQKRILALAVFITAMACITRLSMALGSVLNGLAVLTGLILYYKDRETFRLSEEAKGYLKAFAVFALSTVPSVIFSSHPLTGIQEFFNMWVWRFAVFILLTGFLRRRDYLINMLAVFLAVFGVDCLVAMGQAFLKIGGGNRGWGLGSNQLTIAGIMCMVLPIVLVILMDPRFEKKLKRVSLFTAFSVLIGLLANKSRGSWLTELVVVPAAGWYYIRHSLKYAVIFLLAAGCFIGYMANNKLYVSRFLSTANMTTDHSNADRIWAWKSAKNMVADHPVFGVGLGQFRENYIAKYKYKQETQNLVHSHNNFIQITAECGITGLVGLLYFVGYFLFASLRHWSKGRSPYDLMVFTTVLGFLALFGQIEYTLDNSSGMRIFWFLLALLLQMKENDLAWEEKTGQKRISGC